MLKRLILTTAALALAAGGALAERTDITIGMQLEPPNLDPTGGAAAAIDEVVYANVFEGLTRYQADGSIAPALAESWEISEDGLTYTFTLRPGVKFHDGSDFTADDVKFSLDRARADESTNAQKALFAGIAEVTVVDATTVAVTLSQPNGGFITKHGLGRCRDPGRRKCGRRRHQPRRHRAVQVQPVGPGRPGGACAQRRLLGRTGGAGEGNVQVHLRPHRRLRGDDGRAISDAFPVYPSPETLLQFEADPRFKLQIGSTEGETILSTNNKDEVLSDIRVRQALAHAINRQEIIDGAMFGYGTPIGTHFAPHNPDYVDLTGQSAHDPEKAKALLAEAGYGDGLTLSLKLPPPTYARRGGEIIAAQLRAVGSTPRSRTSNGPSGWNRCSAARTTTSRS